MHILLLYPSSFISSEYEEDNDICLHLLQYWWDSLARGSHRPEAFDDSVAREMSQYNDVLHSNKQKDAAFYVAKSSQERLLPS